MAQTITRPAPKAGARAERPLRLITWATSPHCELARWALDQHRVAYVEEAHAPLLSGPSVLRYGTLQVPVLVTPDGALASDRLVLDYCEAEGLSGQRLIPADPAARVEMAELLALFNELARAVIYWAYSYLLPARRSVLRCWTAGVPGGERFIATAAYPLLAPLVRFLTRLSLGKNRDPRAVIDAVFDQVEARLADGRPYLMGDQLTAADLALGALGAPAVMPEGYGGVIPTLDELPPAMRAAVDELRARPAGQFILRLYHEVRPHPRAAPVPTAAKRHGGPAAALKSWLARPIVLRWGFAALRRFAPILVLGKRVVVSRHADALEVLARDSDFTVAEIYAKRFEGVGTPFILAMDPSPEREREAALLREVVRKDDLERVRRFAGETAAQLVEAARSRGKIDAVGDLARLVPARLVASYIGVAGPDEGTLLHWLRVIFYECFLNLSGVPDPAALRASQGLREFIDAEIARRNADAASTEAPDDVLGRLLALQGPAYPWLDDDTVRRNLSGLMVGAVETTSKLVTLGIDELLRRPAALAAARAAAERGELDTVRRSLYEAARFTAPTPMLFRHCRNATSLASGLPRGRRLPAGSTVVVGLMSAMFDPEAFADPGEFRLDRCAEYLHFGEGLYRCFGRAITDVQAPEIAAALLRLPHLRRAPGSAGRIRCDGPFPDRLLLEFDASPGGGGTR